MLDSLDKQLSLTRQQRWGRVRSASPCTTPHAWDPRGKPVEQGVLLAKQAKVHATSSMTCHHNEGAQEWPPRPPLPLPSCRHAGAHRSHVCLHLDTLLALRHLLGSSLALLLRYGCCHSSVLGSLPGLSLPLGLEAEQ